MNKQLLFWLCCIPMRLLIVWYTKNYPSKNTGYLLSVISFSFLYLYFNNLRLRAAESSTGTTWWAPYRLIHGLLYLAAAIYMFREKQYGWVPLLMDVLLGLFIKSLFYIK